MSKNFWSNLAFGLAGAAFAATAITKYKRVIRLEGQNVLITGGSRGLGLELARIFLSQGANVALAARDGEELERAKLLLDGNSRVAVFVCDVTDEKQVKETVGKAAERFGQIDILVNNAGVIEAGPQESQLNADYKVSMDTHFWAPLFAIQAVLPQMKARRAGRIVNIASIAGIISVPHLLPYCASKHALVGLSDGFRTELMKHNIFVTTVCPGLMRTGSPRNADMKGHNRVEYALFSILDALPFTSIDSQSAARQIVTACKNGDALLVISLQAQMAKLVQNTAPGFLSDIFALTNAILPSEGGIGTATAKGKNSQSVFAPSFLTYLSDKMVRRNNEQS